MANFKILYPDIPFRAATTATSGTISTDLDNCATGGRNELVKYSDAATSRRIDFGLASGLTAQPDYLLIDRLDLITDIDSASITVTLFGNSSAAEGGATSSAATVASSDLKGRYNQTYIATKALGAAFRYHLVKIATTASVKYWVGKIYLGSAFNFDYEPNPVAQDERIVFTGDRRFYREFSLKWEGITGSQKSDFLTKIYKYRNSNPVWLWDTNDLIFFGDRVVMAQILDADFRVNDRESWTIEVKFKELI